MGPPLPGVLHVVPYVPDPYMVANERIDVYYQDHGMHIFIVLHNGRAILGALI